MAAGFLSNLSPLFLLLTAVLIGRIGNWTEGVLGEEQSGLRCGRGCVDVGMLLITHQGMC